MHKLNQDTEKQAQWSSIAPTKSKPGLALKLSEAQT